MDTNILIYGVIFLIGFVLGHIFWPKKNEYIETYNKEDGHGHYDNGDHDNEDEDGDEDDNDEEDDDNGRFYFIDNDDLPEEWNMFDIIVDKETRVQYLQDSEGYSLTPLIDSEGKPILYTGDFDEYDE